MTRYRDNLPQLGRKRFLTDSGLETTLVFLDGIDLPCFAAFDLLKTEKGNARIRDYYRLHAEIALKGRMGFILESPTWRSNPDWGAQLGYDRTALAQINIHAVGLMHDIREEMETEECPMVVSGCVGPRGDGYDPGTVMSIEEATEYHLFQAEVFRDADADMMTAITMTNVPEAIGVALAAKRAGLPCAISFTVETDGNLPSGETLAEAITAVDEATENGPAYYMINCAHPTHFENRIAGNDGWIKRIRGIRANASRMSHAELDVATELDDGNPVELGAQYRDMLEKHPHLTVLGGCCGTDHRHIEFICANCATVA